MKTWLASLLMLVSWCTAAQPAVEIPEALRPWLPWVMYDSEEHRCTPGYGEVEDRFCFWSGILQVEADRSSARFSLPVRLLARGAVPLPGSLSHWPQEVRDGERSLAVVRDEYERPVVWLEAGSYRLSGRFDFEERPESIPLPEEVARVALRLDGEVVPFPQRDGENLWFGRQDSVVAERDSFSMEVFRLLSDTVPAELETHFVITVSGKGREHRVPAVLPEGFEPIALSEELNARLDSARQLHLQLRSGKHTVVLRARARGVLDSLQLPAHESDWPESEIVSFRALPNLRLAEASGAAQIDPALAEVPEYWREYPAYVMGPGDVLKVEAQSRGLSDQDQNRLSLHRTLWLDHDGAGFNARDVVSGSLLRDWRLDLLPPFRALRASENGEPVLITRGADAGSTGVELRSRSLDLQASGRVDEGVSRLPATGWNHDFESVGTTLHVPPGYELVAAFGVDQAPQSWLDRWNLLDVFYAALTVFLFAVAVNRRSALVPAALLLLVWHVPDAPLFALLLAILMSLLLAARVAERLPRFVAWLARAVLVLCLLWSVPFLAGQLRLGLHPQLEAELGMGAVSQFEYSVAGSADAFSDRERAVMAPPPSPAAPMPQAESLAELNVVEVAGSSMENAKQSYAQRAPQKLRRYAGNTVIQAGGGEPDWNWRSYSLVLSGPVKASQTYDLWLSPPWLTRLARFLIVALFGLSAWLLVMKALRLPAPRAAWARWLALGLVLASGPGLASLPDAEQLKTLRNRLTTNAECHDNEAQCAEIASAEVLAEADRLRLALVVHAADRVAVPVPASSALMVLEAIRVDGIADEWSLRDGNGETQIEVTRGVHRVELDYRLAAADRFDLSFSLVPRQVRFASNVFEAAGISEGQLPNGTLELSRLAGSGASEASDGAVAQRFDPYVRVVRELRFDLDWEVYTEVHRLAPAAGAFTTLVPLIRGERVMDSGFDVKDGQVTVRFDDGVASVGFSSRLEAVDLLELSAADLADRAEVWHWVASPTWRVNSSGVPPIHSDNPEHLQSFQPLPGETLRLEVSRPEAEPGRVVAIDSANLMTSLGLRASEHQLSARLRATQGGQHALRIPAGMDVIGISLRGQVLNLRPEDGLLRLPLRPGINDLDLRFRDNETPGLRATTPAIDLGTHASNLNLQMHVPDHRWVVLTVGPRIGPAVLYWGELLFMLVLASLAVRAGWLGLSRREAFLIGIGFSTVSWWALVFFLAALVAFRQRRRWPEQGRGILFNLAQIGLLGFALIAVVVLLYALNQGLLGSPDLHVTGNGSYSSQLRWFADQTEGALPAATAWLLPMWLYRALMLVFAFWMAWFLVRIGREAFESFTAGGAFAPLRRPRREPPPLAPDAPANADAKAAEGAASPTASEPSA